jgi:type IV pilus assembly protein PilW
MNISRNRGFSIIELMVAATLGLLVIAAVGNVFLATSRGYKEDDKISRLQDNLRFAMAQLAVDIEMAGFFAQAANPASDVSLDPSVTYPVTGTDHCPRSWAFENLGVAFDMVGNATAAEAKAKYPCIKATYGFQAGTDVFAVKRVRGTCLKALEENRYYLRTNGYENVLYFDADDDPTTGPSPLGNVCEDTPTGSSVDVYQYDPAIWFIGTERGVPSLCRISMNAAGSAMESSCVAEGIEDMQVEAGMDTSGDGVPDYFTSFNDEPTAAERAQMVAVRVHLLGRSAEPDVHYVNSKSYTLANNPHAAASDHFYRKTLSSVVLMRNPANRISPYALPE